MERAELLSCSHWGIWKRRTWQKQTSEEILLPSRAHMRLTPALQIRNACGTNRAHPVSRSNVHNVLSYSDTSLGWKSRLFFLSVVHIMQAHVCLLEVEFDFCSQCCDVETHWTSCSRLTGQAEQRINTPTWRCQEIFFCQVFQKHIRIV